MAIYHIQVNVVSRGGGRSAVACAAYRAAEKIHDEHWGKTFDFSRKQGVEHKEILAPEGAPEWVQDRSKLWNQVEAAEKRVNSRVAREVTLALPKELNLDQQKELVREFAQENFVRHGMIADVCIHKDNPENPHAHLMLTTREIGPGGFQDKNRTWNGKDLLLSWRENWAKEANLALAKAGHEQRIDHRTYQEQGIALEPTRKLGVRMEEAAGDSREIIQERWEKQQEIIRRNGEAIQENPYIALDAVTKQQATFSQRDVGRWLHTRTADAEQFQNCLAKVMGDDQVVSVGKGKDGRERFTTQEMLQVEKDLVQNSQEMGRVKAHQVGSRFVDQAEATRTLDPEQKAALHHVVHSGDMAVVEGYAGSGKSYMLGAAREAWEAEGYHVKGAALAGKAAESLEISSGIASRSIHSWEYSWQSGKDALTKKDVLVIDEAGMVCSRQMGRVLEHARGAGAKVVLVGDTEQLQAIEAGAPMRKIGEEVGQISLTEIRRQKEDWQRQATQNFASGRTQAGLKAYEERGHVHVHETQEEALQATVGAWDQHRQEYPEQKQIMLAYTRKDVRSMNEDARARRIIAGELEEGELVKTEKGEREFSAGDRVCFLKNDRFMGVKNGTFGTVEKAEKGSMQVRLDDGQGRVVFDTKEYSHLDHGYAATLHKSQGGTFDRTHMVASRYCDRHATYVGMTRHTGQVDLHWSQEEFEGGKKELFNTLSRERQKEMAVDFQKSTSDARELAASLRQLGQSGKKELEGEMKDIEKAQGDTKQPVLSGDEALDKEFGGIEKAWTRANAEPLAQKLKKEMAEEKIPEKERAGKEFQEERSNEKERPSLAENVRKELEKTPDKLATGHEKEDLIRARSEELGELRQARRDYLEATKFAGDKPITLEDVKKDSPNIYDHYASELATKREAMRLKANEDIVRLKPLYEQGEKELPEVKVSQYLNLERISKRDHVTATEVHKQQPEVRKAKQALEQQQAKQITAEKKREIFETDHPWQVKMNRKSWQEIQKNEMDAKNSHEKAEEAFNKTWDDPDLQNLSKQQAGEHNSEIDQAKEQLEELKPGYEQAQC